MAKITGIGGMFLKTEHDHGEIRKFYSEKLGLLENEYGLSIISDTNLTLITLEKGNDKFPYLNLTVDNMDEMIKELKEKKVEVVKEPIEYSYGKFATIKDNLGNLIELWEPYREEYLKMVDEEIKKAGESK
jgi:hypothetical protein